MRVMLMIRTVTLGLLLMTLGLGGPAGGARMTATYGPPPPARERARASPLPPPPPLPPVVFVSESDVRISRRGGSASPAGPPSYSSRRTRPTSPSAAAEHSSSRGTLIAKTRAFTPSRDFGLFQDTEFVTAEGLRVRASDLPGLPVPVPALSSEDPADLPASAPPTPAPRATPRATPTAGRGTEDVPPADPSSTSLSEDESLHLQSLPWPAPPSPLTIVTYYSLDGEGEAGEAGADFVKMMPYLSLVETLVGKHAYQRTPSPSPPPSPAAAARGVPPVPWTPSESYPGPSTGPGPGPPPDSIEEPHPEYGSRPRPRPRRISRRSRAAS